jgi:hypothetical protein
MSRCGMTHQRFIEHCFVIRFYVKHVKYLRRGKVNTGIVIGISVMALLLMLALCAGGGGYYYYVTTELRPNAVNQEIWAGIKGGTAETMQTWYDGKRSRLTTITALSRDYEVFESMYDYRGCDRAEIARWKVSMHDNVKMLAEGAFHEFSDFEMVKNSHGVQFFLEKGILDDYWLKDQE